MYVHKSVVLLVFVVWMHDTHNAAATAHYSLDNGSVDLGEIMTPKKKEKLKEKLKQHMQTREANFKKWLDETNESLMFDRDGYIAGIIILACFAGIFGLLSIVLCCLGANTRRRHQHHAVSAALLRSQWEVPESRAAAPITIEHAGSNPNIISDASRPFNRSPFVPPPSRPRLGKSPCSPLANRGRDVKPASFGHHANNVIPGKVPCDPVRLNASPVRLNGMPTDTSPRNTGGVAAKGNARGVSPLLGFAGKELSSPTGIKTSPPRLSEVLGAP